MLKNLTVAEVKQALYRMKVQHADCIERKEIECRAMSSFQKYFGKVYTVEPREKHTASMIFCHGLGDSGEGWLEFMRIRVAPMFPFMRFILPTAPVMSVSLAEGLSMNSWFDISSVSLDVEEDEVGLLLSAAYVQSLVDQECQKLAQSRCSEQQVFLGGFSQGGALALFSALSMAQEVNGLLCLSGFLPGKNRLKEMRLTNSSRNIGIASASTPIFIAHGEADCIVPIDLARKSVLFLENHLNICRKQISTFYYSDLAHSTNEQEESDILQFIKCNV